MCDSPTSAPQSEELPKQSEEEEFPEEPVDTVESLKEQQQAAIEALDFSLAREIQTKIDTLSSDSSLNKIDQYKAQLTDSLTKCARQNRRIRAAMLSELHKKELTERLRYNDALAELKETQLQEMKVVEQNLFNLYKERMTKPIALYDELIRRAKLTALQCEFAKAQEYQDQADAAKAAEEQNREDLFREVYKSRMGAIFQKHSAELVKLTDEFNVALGKVQKEREDAIEGRAKAYRRDMQRAYQKVVDTIMRSRYDPKNAKQNVVTRKILPELLNELEDEYKRLLVRFGLEDIEVAKKPKLLAPGVRPESKMSLRMQSRLETRESEKKRRDEERTSRMSERALSKNSARSPSQQSPRGASRSGVRKSE